MPKLPHLKRVREQKLLTTRELAAKSGLSPTAINDLENHGVNARPSTVRKLSAALDAPPTDLLAD